MKKYKMYGKTTMKKDNKLPALSPGWRISKKTGEPYFERRANRCDKDRRKKL